MESVADSKRVVLDEGRVYELRPWSPDDGQRWLVALMRIAFKALAGGDRGSELLAIGAVMEVVDEKTLLDFWRTCRKYTSLIGEDDREGHRGEETVLPLDVREKRGEGTPYIDIVALVMAHAEGEYADFFRKLPALIASQGKGSSKSSSPKE